MSNLFDAIHRLFRNVRIVFYMILAFTEFEKINPISMTVMTFIIGLLCAFDHPLLTMEISFLFHLPLIGYNILSISFLTLQESGPQNNISKGFVVND